MGRFTSTGTASYPKFNATNRNVRDIKIFLKLYYFEFRVAFCENQDGNFNMAAASSKHHSEREQSYVVNNCLRRRKI